MDITPLPSVIYCVAYRYNNVEGNLLLIKKKYTKYIWNWKNKYVYNTFLKFSKTSVFTHTH